MAHDVFISFSTEDKAIADAACAILEAKRIRCWIAPRDVQPGIPFPQAIMEGIRGSRALVLILSAKSNTSKHVMREVERAVNCEIPVVPIRIEDVSLSGSMEYLVGSLHWLDALTPPLERHLETLARRILALIAETGGVEAAARTLSGNDALTKGDLESAQVAPKEGGPPSTSFAAQQMKAWPQGDDGLPPAARPTLVAVSDLELRPKQPPASRGRGDRATSIHPEGAPPKRRNVPLLWVSLAAVPLLALLAYMIYKVTDDGTVKITGTDRKHDFQSPNTTGETKSQTTARQVASPRSNELIGKKIPEPASPSTVGASKSAASTTKVSSPVELGGKIKHESPTTSTTSETKSPTSTSSVPSPKPSPVQSSREWTNTLGMKFVRIEPGEFLMGTTKDQVDQFMRLFPDSKREYFDDEQPQHPVTISRPFFLGIHEVTQGQYADGDGQ